MKNLCYVNGEILSADAGAIGVSDLALQRAYGVFDYGRTYNGKLFHFEDNLKRFHRSASELHLAPPIPDGKIREIAEELIEESGLNLPSIRMILTGGYSPTLEDPNFIIIAEELPTYPGEVYRDGAKVVTAEFQRELPHIKTINYLNAIRLEPFMRRKGAFDILYHSTNGITECPRNNFFAFIGDTLITPSDSVLHGITRKIVLKLAAEKFEIEERMIRFAELDDFDEAFTTATTKRIVPVTRIDDKEIGSGSVGDRTKTLMRMFDEYTSGY